jgi:hypothetical protein
MIVDILLENGVPMKNIALSVQIKPSIMISNLENLKRLVQKASLMGFHPSKFQESICFSNCVAEVHDHIHMWKKAWCV